MREAGAPNTRKLLLRFGQLCARPTGDSHGRTTDAAAQRFNGENLTATLEVGYEKSGHARSGVKKRGQGQYKGQDTPKDGPAPSSLATL
jgi:hypothetical protein